MTALLILVIIGILLHYSFSIQQVATEQCFSILDDSRDQMSQMIQYELEPFASVFLPNAYRQGEQLMVFERGTGDLLIDSWNDGLGSIHDLNESGVSGFDWETVQADYLSGGEGHGGCLSLLCTNSPQRLGDHPFLPGLRVHEACTQQQSRAGARNHAGGNPDPTGRGQRAKLYGGHYAAGIPRRNGISGRGRGKGPDRIPGPAIGEL